MGYNYLGVKDLQDVGNHRNWSHIICELELGISNRQICSFNRSMTFIKEEDSRSGSIEVSKCSLLHLRMKVQEIPGRC